MWTGLNWLRKWSSVCCDCNKAYLGSAKGREIRDQLDYCHLLRKVYSLELVCVYSNKSKLRSDLHVVYARVWLTLVL